LYNMFLFFVIHPLKHLLLSLLSLKILHSFKS
jgi:hypothetical protein